MANSAKTASAGLVTARITVVGAKEVGKTCLIAGFVNNFHPTVYVGTEEPTLYYKIVEVPLRSGQEEGGPFGSLSTTARSAVTTTDRSGTEGTARSSESAPQGVAVLVELEDSFPWTSGGSANAAKFLTPQELVSRPGKVQQPPSDAPPMANSLAPAPGRYRPITHTRMGFLVLFDVMEPETYKEAKDILDKLRGERGFPGSGPVVWLVACKTDQLFRGASTGSPESELVEEAEREAKRRRIKFMDLATTDFIRIRRLMREVCSDIFMRPDLWKAQSNGLAHGMKGMFSVRDCTTSGGDAVSEDPFAESALGSLRASSRGDSARATLVAEEPQKQSDCSLQ